MKLVVLIEQSGGEIAINPDTVVAVYAADVSGCADILCIQDVVYTVQGVFQDVVDQLNARDI